MKRAIASLARRGSGWISLSITALEAGTQTSNFGNLSASTIASATSSGSSLPDAAGIRKPGAELGVDHRRHHHRDLDPGVAELGAHGLAQADDGVLGRAVGGAAGKPDLPGLRSDVDDVTARPAASCPGSSSFMP